ncbi:MAG TPA: SDR family oxidoreductase [Burkholderiales bacterium]|nr:SDR family oxidoreductase [Burkholderiales bacterium]
MSEKVCVVTGSTGNDGTGSATVKYFAKQGWRVVVNYSKSADAAARVADECKRLGASAVLSLQADVTKDDDCRRMAKSVEESWGRCDVLVNNAATTKFVNHADLDGLSAEDFQTIFGVNVTGVYLMTRAFAALLRNSQGSVVNISSMGGVQGTGSCMAYGASKAALNAMTMSLARVLAPQVRVNAVLPGFITGDWLKNGFGQAAYEAMMKNRIDTSPLANVLDPVDVAEAVWWLGSGPGKLTGELIHLDSGHRLGAAPARKK